MRLPIRVCNLFALLVLALFPLNARAGSLIAGSLGDSDDGFSVIVPVTAWAQEFTTPTAVSFSAAYAYVGDLDLGNNNDFAVTATLYSVTSETAGPDSGPGTTLVGTFTVNVDTPILTSGMSTVEFDLTSPVTLSSSLYYWFVLSGTSTVSEDPGSLSWGYTNEDTTYGPGALPGYTTNNPGTFTDNYVAGSPFLFQAGGEIGGVPEPSSLILAVMGLSGAVLAGFRARSRGAKRLIARID